MYVTKQKTPENVKTINDLGFYNLCSRLNNFDPLNTFDWYSFDAPTRQKLNPDEAIGAITYRILLELFSTKEEVAKQRPLASLEYWERYYNDYLQVVCPQVASKKASAGWIRLVNIYLNIIKMSESYDYVADNLTHYKRIFKENPIVVKFTIPLIFTNKKGEVDVVVINPIGRTDLASLSNMFVLDLLEEFKIKAKQIIEISYSVKNVSKAFTIHKYLPFQSAYDQKTSFFDGLLNGNSGNLKYCTQCFYKNKCTSREIAKKVLL